MGIEGKDIKAGAFLKVWWARKVDQVMSFKPSVHAGSRIAVFSSGISMTVFDGEMYEAAQ